MFVYVLSPFQSLSEVWSHRKLRFVLTIITEESLIVNFLIFLPLESFLVFTPSRDISFYLT